MFISVKMWKDLLLKFITAIAQSTDALVFSAMQGYTALLSRATASQPDTSQVSGLKTTDSETLGMPYMWLGHGVLYNVTGVHDIW